MWRWLYNFLFHGFVLEVFDVLSKSQDCQDAHISDLQRDVKRLYNMTNGTQALENLLEKKLAGAMTEIDELKKKACRHERSLSCRSIETDQCIKAVENRVVELYNTGLKLFEQIRHLEDRLDDLKLGISPKTSRLRRANALMAPRDNRGRFVRKDAEACEEAE